MGFLGLNIIDMTDKQRSRKLTIYEFFEILQIEFIVAELRVKIYERHSDKEYWRKVMEGKRKTIEDIAQRNGLPTIFSDDDMKRDFEYRVYKDNIPKFYYRSEEHRLRQEFNDLSYYFKAGVEVRIDLGGDVQVGTVKNYRPFDTNMTVVVKSTGENVTLPIQDVQRIL